VGDITISGGGSTAVATDGMLEAARRLGELDLLLADLCDGLAYAPPAPGAAAFDAAGDIALARDAVEQGRELAARLRHELNAAAERYGAAERATADELERSGAALGYLLGVFAPALLLDLVAALPGIAAFLLGAAAVTGSPERAVDLGRRFVAEHRGLLRDPRVVELVRQIVSATDDGILGLAGVPYPIVRALDDRATGLFGLHGAAGLVSALAPGSMLKETPVTVTGASAGTVSAPGGFADLASRIPSSAPGAPQVRIERYDTGAARPSWIVYVGGTVDPGFTPSGEPWDDTSNVNGIAAFDTGSIRATRDAMEQAGIRPGDAVLPVGYSQGGIVATSLVTSGDAAADSLITFGSPTGQVPLPVGVHDVAVEHRDDIIVALGGDPPAADDGGLNRVVVRRTSFDGALPMDESPIQAHLMSNYSVTAERMDASSDPRLEAAREHIAALTGGAPAEVSVWRGDRVLNDARSGAG
jgi:hypothetical protein